MNSPYEGRFYISQGYYPSRHDGLDLVGIDSKEIHATQKGVVHYAGWQDPADQSQGFGLYVCIKGIDNLFYYYGHMSKILVKAGDSVNITDVIGIEGSTGYSTGSHCHYEVRKAFYKGAEGIDVCSLSGIPNNENATYDDGYRPKQTSGINVGSLVKINSDAKYYDGQAIPDWVKADSWYVSSLSSNRAVLGQNKTKTRNIQSPIKTSDLKLVTMNIDNVDDIKALQTALNTKGYKCEVNGKNDTALAKTMFEALCDAYNL